MAGQSRKVMIKINATKKTAQITKAMNTSVYFSPFLQDTI